MKRTQKSWSKFEEELISSVPSNEVLAEYLNRSLDSVACKRNEMRKQSFGVVKSKPYTEKSKREILIPLFRIIKSSNLPRNKQWTKFENELISLNDLNTPAKSFLLERSEGAITKQKSRLKKLLVERDTRTLNVFGVNFKFPKTLRIKIVNKTKTIEVL